MELNPYKNISEKELIEKYNSPTTSREESDAIFTYLWKKHLPFIAEQCRRFFSNNTFINFDDILQECAPTFLNVLRSYDPTRGKLITALVPHLRHTFSNYMATEHNCSRYDNMIIAHIKKILLENELTGNEDITYLTDLYNKKYSNQPLSPKSLKRHLELCKMQDLVYLDQYSPELLQFTEQVTSDPTWQDINNHATYTLIRDYIERAAENDSPLLLFLFGFLPNVEIDGHLYSATQKEPIRPLRKACFKLFPPYIVKCFFL